MIIVLAGIIYAIIGLCFAYSWLGFYVDSFANLLLVAAILATAFFRCNPSRKSEAWAKCVEVL